MGDPAIGTNPIYRQLLDNLTAYGGGPISIRVGGNTTDTTALPDASTVSPFAALFEDQRHVRKDGVFFYLGVNLGSDVVALAASQAKVFVQNMPKGSIRNIEIGNEPDVYFLNGHRPSTYDYTDYALDFQTWAKSIFAAVPDSPLLLGPSDATYPGATIGPVSIGTTILTADEVSSLLQQEGSSLAVVSQHSYENISTNAGPLSGNPQVTECRRLDSPTPSRRERGPMEVVGQVEEWVQSGIKVCGCYEAEACGYHRELSGRGAVNFVVVPRA